MVNKRQMGTAYEDRACDFLREQGLVILERNYRKRIGEIDIIARDGDCLTFIEVKYRSGSDRGGAAYAIPRSKQLKIARVAQWYLAEKHVPADTFCRFDAVLIDAEEIRYEKNAWRM